jgi:tetratricopeptide (TPR) repeat protein
VNDQFDKAILHYNEAVVYYDKGKFDNAISSATQAIFLFPDLAPAYNVRGNAYYGKKDYKKSIEDKTIAIRLTEKKKEELQREIGNSGNVKTNEILNEMNTSKAWLYFNRGNAYDDLGDFENAEKDFSEAIRLIPKFANAYHSRGEKKKKNGDYISAIEDFTKAIENDYKILHFAYNNRADALYHLKRYEEAISDCQAAIDIDPAYARAYNTCGIIYESMNDLDNARLYFKRAIAVNPNDPGPKKTLQNLYNYNPRMYQSSTTISLGPNYGIGYGDE